MIWQSKFDAEAVANALPDATVLMGVPTFYVRLLALESFRSQNVDHMRVFICGSAPLTEQVFEEWETVTGH